MKTIDDWRQYLLFMLLDINIDEYNYIAIDYDGEIIVCEKEMMIERSDDADMRDDAKRLVIETYWVHRHDNIRTNSNECTRTGIYLSENMTPDNFDTMMIKL